MTRNLTLFVECYILNIFITKIDKFIFTDKITETNTMANRADYETFSAPFSTSDKLLKKLDK